MTNAGPIQLVAVGFGPEAQYRGEILDALQRLQGHGMIRVLDLLFVGEDSERGELIALDFQGDSLGALVGRFLGFAFKDAPVERVVVTGPPGPMALGLTRAHLEALIRAKPPQHAIGVALIEHLWARDLKRAVREADAETLADGFLAPAALDEIAAELEDAVHSLDAMEREQSEREERALRSNGHRRGVERMERHRPFPREDAAPQEGFGTPEP